MCNVVFMNQSTQKTIRIISFNTWKCDGNYLQRIEAMKQQLVLLAPDIIALQECFAAEEINIHTASTLSAHLNMPYKWAPARFKARNFYEKMIDSYSGLAILSRFPFQDHQVINLPSATADGERIAQIVRLEINHRIILIANLHLTHLKGAQSLRKEQLNSLMKNISEGLSTSYTFLCGDFNTEVDTAPLQFLENSFQASHSFYLFQKLQHPPATIHDMCIDFIYTLPDKNGIHPTCLESAIVLHESHEGVYPSDHKGVMATFLL